jgi:hypothetical protein
MTEHMSKTSIRDRLDVIRRLAHAMGMAATGSDASDYERDCLEAMASHIAVLIAELSEDIGTRNAEEN